MRNIMKKRTMISVLIALLLLFLVACGQQKTQTSTDGGNGNHQATNETVGAQTQKEETKQPDLTATEAPTPTPTEAPTPTELPVAKAPSAEELPGIKDVFADYNLKVGTCLSDYMVTKDNCKDLIQKNFNSITFENHLKPDYILDQAASKEAGDIRVKFSPATITLLDWCKENGFAMRGHTLIWHSQTPTWIFHEDFDTTKPRVGREVMLGRMQSYIRQVFETLEAGEWIENFYAYDIINEAWIDDGSMRPESLWLQTIGDDYMWYAFYYANAYAPEYIDLYYNDFNEQFKTDALYNFVKTLVDEDGNYLIDGVGFQAHLYTEDDLDLYFHHMDKMAELGVKLSLTELDVCLGTYPVIKMPTEENLKAQGRYYYDLIGGILERVKAEKVKMDSLTIWGFGDSLSWRKERNPLLYNMKFEPKYALYGLLQMKEYAGFDE